MSRLESRAKPFLIPLIKNRNFVLDPSAQSIVAAWAAMTMITAEFDNPNAVAVPLSDRQWLMNNMVPPNRWTIWLGKYQGRRGNYWFRHHGLRFSLSSDSSQSTLNPVIVDGDEPCNAQVTILITGALLLHAFSTIVPAIRFNEAGYAMNLGIRRIWPGTGVTIVWDNLAVLGDIDAEAIANTLTESFP
jgi:hypothetical protein